ncbi:MAG TPA: carbamoyltransferase C-terminal domain-containing protein [Vicinamibacterales bacterium]|nr:carbamoyltransferase C-terminal domain-containing protein [Vicinamibacterales bacterium]
MATAPWVLGVSTGFHNGAACLLHGDELVVAIQEERLTRIKRDRIDSHTDSLAIRYCLEYAGITESTLDAVVECSIGDAAQDHASQLACKLCPAAGARTQRYRIPHHLGHAVSVFATSGLSDAVTVVIDGAGSYGWELPEAERKAALSFEEAMSEHITIYECSERGVVPIEKHLSNMPYMHHVRTAMMMPGGMLPFASLGHMFSSVALQLFGDYMEAGKVMGLAPYGQPSIDRAEFFEIDGQQFRFTSRVIGRFAHDARWPERADEYKDLASSTQQALEDALLSLFARVRRLGVSRSCCYAGGVALNSVANHKLMGAVPFDDVFVIPAAEDSGTAIGAAYYGLMQLRAPRRHKRLATDYLGRVYSSDAIRDAIQATPGVMEVPASDLPETVATLLTESQIVGWYDGGAEFGPRALGHRSILCDPRLPDAKRLLNERIKFRESFRPFAPIVLSEELSAWFAVPVHRQPVEFMLDVCPFVTPVAEAAVPGVTHVDGTGRVQALSAAANPSLCAVVRRFFEKTGVPMLVNTSLNIMGEPIVETPGEALWLLLSTGVDCCVLGEHVVRKAPDFTTPLDLVPQRTAEILQVQSDWTQVKVQTEHGPHVYAKVPSSLAAMLQYVDGIASGRDVIRRRGGAPMDDLASVRLLGLLVRLSMIRFATSPADSRKTQTSSASSPPLSDAQTAGAPAMQDQRAHV